jgi:uncharacterized protein (TIGR02145 family)
LAGTAGATGATGAAGPQGPVGLTGPAGVAGTNGINGTNGTAVLNGNTNPVPGTGVNGDFYINTATNELFGPKANGTWPVGVSLVGPQGTQGIQGPTGATGPAGVAGPQGLAGTAGATGATGATGPAGASGLLTSGSAAGNTPYWDGSQWVVNGTNLYNNGTNIGIGTVAPNATAIADLTSTTQGFLMPRMTTIQRNAIVNPANGLMIFNLTTGCPNYFFNNQWYEWCGTGVTPVAAISSINCAGATTTGTLTQGMVSNNVSVSIGYLGGNGGSYSSQSIASTGVTGLTATLSQGNMAIGAGTLSFTITGTPASAGTATFAITVGGQSCNLTISVASLATQYPANSTFCANGPTAIVNVTNPTTGKTWMDRNLGATQVATSTTDQAAYGDLYQWGRRTDGHQCRTSTTTATLSSVDQPAHGSFITGNNAPFDWRSPQNANLWQGVNGVNNPCPNGYRIPTETELNNDRLSWPSSNAAGGFASALKLSMGGIRYYDGSLLNVGGTGRYWSSNLNGTNTRSIEYDVSGAAIQDNPRSYGMTVRCIRETLGAIGALNCGGSTTAGNLFSGSVASNVSASVPYTGGNGGYYAAQTTASTGVTGLTATLSQGVLINGAGSLNFTISGTPASAGIATFAIMLGGQSCSFTVSVGAAQPQYPAGTVHCAGATTVVDVTNPTTGKTWMDRNLGATQVATSSTDVNAYGDLYQWGRRADGHQCRTSPTTATLSSVDQPAHGNFILAPNAPNDWRSPQNANLWQGVNGVNNPCPSGYRIPTETELDAERLSWTQQNSVGAFASPLKLSVTGRRDNSNGLLSQVGGSGMYWCSTVSGAFSRMLFFPNNQANMNDYYRAYGLTVRCIKDASAIPAAVGTLNCGGATTAGNLFSGSVASNVSASVPYTGGNAGSYSAQSVSSTGVVGLTATLAAGSLANGAGSLTYTITGTPTTSGTASFAITVGGQSCSFTVSVGAVQPQYPAGTVHCAGATTVVDVTNPTTGRIWMDRNLGASQVATSFSDTASFGDLYQWGRRADGHQCRTSPTTATLSSIDQPAHGDFILAPNAPNDWRSPQNANLWQGVNGVNNPCPSGYRLPTETEFSAELLSWTSYNNIGAFNSPLKITMAGVRSIYNGTLIVSNIGGIGYYWTSTVNGINAFILDCYLNGSYMNGTIPRNLGLSVRCIKN